MDTMARVCVCYGLLPSLVGFYCFAEAEVNDNAAEFSLINGVSSSSASTVAETLPTIYGGREEGASYGGPVSFSVIRAKERIS